MAPKQGVKKEGTANLGEGPRKPLLRDILLATNCIFQTSHQQTREQSANGHGSCTSGGGGSSPAGESPDEREALNGGGQAASQGEQGRYRRTTGPPGEEPETAVLEGDTALDTHVAPHRAVQPGQANITTERGIGKPNPREQTAENPQTGIGEQTSNPAPSRDADAINNLGIPNTENPNRRTRRERERQLTKNTKAAIRVASLNIRGYTHTESRTSKWNHVNQLVREKRIGILVVSETHLNEERKERVERDFSKRLRIHISQDPVNPSGKGGIAVVLNKELTNVNKTRVTEIVPGRAMLVQTNWHRAEEIAILAIYAPNVTQTDGDRNEEFWGKIDEFLDENPETRIDIMAGDFNMVEDEIDRLPTRPDPENATRALRKVTTRLELVDGWRATFPDTKAYTFLQDSTGSQSRIDRIYSTEKIMETAREWSIKPTGIPGTDHDMVSVQVAHEQAPEIGKGRWTIKNHVIRDKNFRKFVHESGIAALDKIEGLAGNRNKNENPQTVYLDWKSRIMKKARDIEKAIVPRTKKKIETLEKSLLEIANNDTLDAHTRAELTSDAKPKLRLAERQRHQQVRAEVAVRNRLEGETICRYWSQSNKEAKPRDIIYALEKEPANGDPDTMPQYEKSSKRMAELARDYHKELQIDRNPPDPAEREEKIIHTLEKVDASLTREQAAQLGAEVSEDEVLAALKASKNNTAAGKDGATYELWKTLQNRYEEDMKKETPAFNIIRLLTLVYRDIKTFGTNPNSSFAEGWMCPIYKKKERTKIANYRPITLLNTDYKVFTKALAMRLAEVICTVIHPSQAGFIPGRKITDQTKLIRMVMEYAEAADTNGIIVALDQEKAYDKIDHEYLWQTLKKFGIPDSFISTVRSLYQNAETQVMINGHLSSKWRITRGVRQGDPLSCLLFDIAIEPLAILLRKSGLRGFEIPGAEDRLIATLFADDTTTFLSNMDDIAELQKILDDWCIASKAKFNTDKTEIIPIGTKAYRENVINTRKTRDDGPEIPNSIHIAKEGEAIRILGAWYGNETAVETPWLPIVEKVDRYLNRWEMSKPTIEGRRLIIQMVVGGITQYLTQVQGMPDEIEKKLTKRIREYIWDDKKSPVSEQHMFSPIGAGGRGLLDLKSRNEAIDIMWLKSYLHFGPERPLWALLADKILAIKTPKSEKNVKMETKQNIFLQSWKTLSSASRGASKDLNSILKTASKYGLRPEGLSFSVEIIRSRPIWYHREADSKIRRLNHGTMIPCLLHKHKIVTVGDAHDLARGLENPAHIPNNECECIECMKLDNELNCEHPHDCMTRAEKLINTLPPKWNPKLQTQAGGEETRPDSEEDEWITFDPRLRTEGTLSEVFRIFTEGETSNNTPLVLTQEEDHNPVRIILQGACKNEGTDDAKATGAIKCQTQQDLSGVVSVPPEIGQSRQNGATLAIGEAAVTYPQEHGLEIELNSSRAMKRLTKNLKSEEDEGYIGRKDAPLIKAVTAALRRRKMRTRFKVNEDHVNSRGTSNGTRNINLSLDVNGNNADLTLKVSGAKLSRMTQSLAYKAVRLNEMKKTGKRRRTEEMIDHTKHCHEDMFKKMPTEEQIWKSLRSKDLSKKSQYFLWMTMHDAYMVGEKWLRPNFREEIQNRATCPHDGEMETMDHILTKCSSPGQAEIWEEAKSLWTKKSPDTWYEPVLGTILGAPLANFKNNRKRDKGKTRLYRILMTESAYLIWILRCERVIQNENAPFTRNEVRNKWTQMIQERFNLDRKMTKKTYGKKGIPAALVKATWQGVLKDEHNLPEDWVGNSEVLVGISPSQQHRGEEEEGEGEDEGREEREDEWG